MNTKEIVEEDMAVLVKSWDAAQEGIFSLPIKRGLKGTCQNKKLIVGHHVHEEVDEYEFGHWFNACLNDERDIASNEIESLESAHEAEICHHKSQTYKKSCKTTNIMVEIEEKLVKVSTK